MVTFGLQARCYATQPQRLAVKLCSQALRRHALCAEKKFSYDAILVLHTRWSRVYFTEEIAVLSRQECSAGDFEPTARLPGHAKY